MTQLRFSLASMLGFVVLAAGGTAVLANPTPMWASALLTATVALMLVAVLGGLFAHGAVRAFLLGYALCGGAYLLFVYHPWFSQTLGPNLLTTKWLEFAERRLQSTGPQPQAGAVAVTNLVVAGQGQGGFVGVPTTLATPTYTPSQLIGHSLWMMLIGFAGGLVSRFFYVRRPAGPANPTAAS